MVVSADNKEARFKEAAHMSSEDCKIVVSFETGNDDAVGLSSSKYGALVLLEVAKKLSEDRTHGTVRDRNGNTIGRFYLIDIK